MRGRDALGRPVPLDDPAAVPPVPEEAFPPDDALALAQQLLDAGRAFSAHEVLEASWKAAPAGERDLWQGLAQLCVGLTQAARGNAIGADRLLDRGAGRLEEYGARGGTTHGLDLAAVIACAREEASLQE